MLDVSSTIRRNRGPDPAVCDRTGCHHSAEDEIDRLGVRVGDSGAGLPSVPPASFGLVVCLPLGCFEADLPGNSQEVGKGARNLLSHNRLQWRRGESKETPHLRKQCENAIKPGSTGFEVGST